MDNEALLKKYLVWREGEERLKKYLRLMIALNELMVDRRFIQATSQVAPSFPWLAFCQPEPDYAIGPWNLMG